MEFTAKIRFVRFKRLAVQKILHCFFKLTIFYQPCQSVFPITINGPFLYYCRDKDAREIGLLLEQDGTLFPIELKKMAAPPKKLTKYSS